MGPLVHVKPVYSGSTGPQSICSVLLFAHLVALATGCAAAAGAMPQQLPVLGGTEDPQAYPHCLAGQA